MVWVWCVCFCSVLGIRWQLVFLAHCTVQMLLQLTTRAIYMYWSVFQTVFDVVIKRHACVCVCISFYAYLLHMPGILLSCSVYACAQVCVDVCVCVYVHTFKHLLSKGDLGRGGVNSSMCVVLFDTYLVYMH